MKRVGVAIPTYDRNDLLSRLMRTIPHDVSIFVSDNGGKVTIDIEKEFHNLHLIKHSSIINIFEKDGKTETEAFKTLIADLEENYGLNVESLNDKDKTRPIVSFKI